MEERLVTYLRRTNRIKGNLFHNPASGYQKVLCIEDDFEGLKRRYHCLHISPPFHHRDFLREVFIFWGKKRDN